MRLTTTLVLTLALLVMFITAVAVYAKERTETVTITLTEDQAKSVANARGSNVEVQLTDAQIKSIYKSCAHEPPTWSVKVTLNTSHLRSGDTVLLELSVPDDLTDPNARIGMDPQPSPKEM